jgi:hypothetical protein
MRSIKLSKNLNIKRHPKPFYYMGTTCYWINDVEWRKQKLNSFNGIACQIKEHEWILVDKF